MFLKFRDLRYNLNNVQIQILQLLKRKAMYGYEIIQKFEDRGTTLNTAILYPALKDLEKMKLVESFESEQSRGAKKRKNYELTEKGFSFISSLFDMGAVPEHYLKIFEEEIEKVKFLINKRKSLIIDSTNFLDAKALFSTKYFYNVIPFNIDFMRYYDFKMEENIEKRDYIFILFPFFIQYKFDESFQRYIDQLFDKIQVSLTENGEAWILDLYWTRNAIIDTFTYLIAGEVRKMGFTPEEMKKYLRKYFSNYNLVKKQDGLILFSVS
ncbi:MAG: hypothetical protein GF329_20740 [Candidatus Lokiarchaeota archaeon]|nr:hypothetical protein [Candidatus Lokiarchaeota archaeon]